MNEHRITRLGLRGDGIAEGPVYAPRTLPGEVVAGTLEGSRIVQPRILSPSRHRVRAPCAHYKSCGGCQLMHASDAFVANWKVGVVQEALAAQGLVAEVAGIATSPERSRRRATLHGRRLKSGAVVGFHAARSDTVTATPECRVLAPAILAVLPALKEITTLAGSRRGRLSFSVTETDNGLDCAVVGGPDLDGRLAQELPHFADRFARLSWNGDLVFANPVPRLRIGPAEITPPPGAFLQATKEGEATLTNEVLRAMDGAESVADLFAGCGTFSFPASEVAEVHAVEADSDLIEALASAARTTSGIKPISTERRDLFRRPLDAEELRAFDGIIIDPPRAGAAAQTMEIAKATIPQVAMVSCNPVTFARDARVLADAGYRIERLAVVDQFRWSTHVELVAALRHAAAAS